jgi:bacterioferritin
MATEAAKVTRAKLIDLLNEDLAREYQAIIAYVIYSQVLKGAQYMSIAGELEKHAAQELQHALIIAKQIDYLGGMPTNTPRPVKLSDKAEDMLRFDLDNENETVRNYRERVRQCEALGEYAMAEHIREILIQEQEHQIDLASALGKDVSEVTKPEERAGLQWVPRAERHRGARPPGLPGCRGQTWRSAPTDPVRLGSPDLSSHP